MLRVAFVLRFTEVHPVFLDLFAFTVLEIVIHLISSVFVFVMLFRALRNGVTK